MRSASAPAKSTKTASYHHGNLRASLLKRASEVIAEGGVEALSMRGLARDLNVSSAASARHFNSKLELLRTIAIEGYRQATEATLKAAANPQLDPAQKLNAMGKAFVHWSLNNHALFHTISHPDVSRRADERLISAMAEFTAALRASLQHAQKAGYRAEEDPEILLQYIIGGVRGVAFNLSDELYTSVYGKTTKRKADKLVDLIIPV